MLQISPDTVSAQNRTQNTTQNCVRVQFAPLLRQWDDHMFHVTMNMVLVSLPDEENNGERPYLYDSIAMIGTSDQSCWLAEACKILLPLLLEFAIITQ